MKTETHTKKKVKYS